MANPKSKHFRVTKVSPDTGKLQNLEGEWLNLDTGEITSPALANCYQSSRLFYNARVIGVQITTGKHKGFWIFVDDALRQIVSYEAALYQEEVPPHVILKNMFNRR